MSIEGYWKEAEAIADVLLPIPPRACLDDYGKVIRTDRCLQCPMKITCKLKEDYNKGIYSG